MRRFELILLFASAFAVFWPVVFGVRPRRGIVAISLAATIFAQIQFEGVRWQLIPLYLTGVGLAVGDLLFVERSFDWSGRVLRGLLGAIGLIVASGLPFALPVPELPTPGGPEAIGTMSVQLIDRQRDELYGPSPGGPREFVAQVWYPARADATEPRVPWVEDWEVVIPAMGRAMGLPSWFWSQTKYTMSHASDSSPVADGTFPVIVYSHGWDGLRTNSLNQIEDLVSNGYIVIAPDHPYIATATTLDDHEVVLQDPDALPDAGSVGESAHEEALTQLVATQAGDLVTIFDQLEEGEEGSFSAIVGNADLNRIGVYGHGTGGAAAILACLDEEDERCSAVLAMDPWVSALTERDLQQTMTRPALYMRSQDWIGTEDDALLSGIAARGQAITYTVGIEGTTTNDFLMIPLLSPFATQFGLKGPISAGRVITIVDNYLLGFFDVFLLDTGSAQLDSVSFDEVEVSVFDPSG